VAPKYYQKIAWVVTTLQEAYSAIVPYFLLTSFIALLVAMVYYFDLSPGWIDLGYLTPLLDSLDMFSSIVITITIAYFFARRLEVMPIIAITLGVATYVTVMVVEESTSSFLFGYSYGFVIQTLVVPVVSTFLLRVLYPWLNLRIPLEDQNIHIYRLFNYIFVFAAAYVLTVVFYLGIDYVMDNLLEYLQEHVELSLPEIVLLGIRDLGVEFFWFLGIHGDHTVNAMAGKEFLGEEIFSHLSVGEFNRLFVFLGGAGSGLALLIALLIYAKKGIIRTIARISVPFVIFNINTLLIYSVVVFNRYLLIPFLLIPLFNLGVAYGVLTTLSVSFDAHSVTWNTPIFLDAYIKTGGDWRVMALQGGLLLADTLIYMHFVRRFLLAQSHTVQMAALERRLELPYSIRAGENIRSFVAHRNIIASNARLDEVISSIEPQRMMVYFQPKIDMDRGVCDHFEVLLRYRYDDRIALPEFLGLIEEAGLAPTLDVWVAKEVAATLLRWENLHFFPTVSINLHPDTLAHSGALNTIIGILKGRRVVFEIVERSFIEGSDALKGVKRLQTAGFGISIDDYGVGYSNLEAILNHQINEIKIDKAIIDRIEEERGVVVCRHIIALSRSLGISIVAEGVEGKKQVEILRSLGVEYIQGFYFSPALPGHQAPAYARDFRLEQQIRHP